MAYEQKFFLGEKVRFIELEKITKEYENEAWINAVNTAGETPLHIVARNNNLQLFKSMLPFYTNIEATDNVGNTVLHVLADHNVEKCVGYKRKRINLIYALISEGADINKRNRYGWTLVHFAAKHCHIEILRFLKKNAADFNLQTMADGTPLILACKYMFKMRNTPEERKTIDFFLDRISDINATDAEGYSALHYAVQRCGCKTVIKLLKRGADVHLRTKKYKLTPLHCAAETEHNLPVVKILLKAGAVVESHQKIEEITPLHMSLLGGSLDIVKYLIKNGADVNYPDGNLHFTPLHLTVYQKRYDLFQLLIDKGADVNGSDKDGLTPLHLSSMLGCSKFTEALISLGARVNCLYDDQLTPLHLASLMSYILDNDKLAVAQAIKHGKEKSLIAKLLTYSHDQTNQDYETVIQLLLRNGADINAVTMSGWSPLHLATKSGRHTANFVKILLEHGANVDYQEPSSGFTALHFASANNLKTVIEVLINAGADVNALTKNGKRPIHLALQSDCPEMLEILIKYGAVIDCKETHSRLTPLHLALKKKHKDAATVLITSGADVNILTPDGKSPVHLALESNTAVWKLLVRHGSNIHYKEPYAHLTPLHVALIKNQSDAAEILINAGADVNTLTRDGRSPMYLHLESSRFKECMAQSIKILTLLIAHGANINYKEPHSQSTPLHLALSKIYHDAAITLINAGADVNSLTQDGNSPLHLVVESMGLKFFDEMSTVVLKLLVDRGADVNCIEPLSQSTPLHIALNANHIDAVEILIKAGANINAFTQNGMRPIHLASLSNCTNILKLLINHGANVNCKTLKQLTPLHLALDKNHQDAAIVLINEGADIDALTPDGHSPMHLALERNCKQALNFLMACSAKLNCHRRRCLYTLLYVTAQGCDEDMCDRLNDFDKTPLLLAVDTQDREIKRAVFRLSALVDACNENSCMLTSPDVEKCCIENSTCLRICGLDSHDVEAHRKFISYRVLSGTFHEFSDRQIINETNPKYLFNFLSMLNAVHLPLTYNYETVRLSRTSVLFNNNDIVIYDKQCRDEVKKLKSYSISNDATLYNVLHMRPRHRHFYMKNFLYLHLFEIESKFNIYYKLILAYYYEDKIRTILMETAYMALYQLTDVDLPVTCLDEIFWNLGIVDMIATIEAAEKCC